MSQHLCEGVGHLDAHWDIPPCRASTGAAGHLTSSSGGRAVGLPSHGPGKRSGTAALVHAAEEIV